MKTKNKYKRPIITTYQDGVVVRKKNTKVIIRDNDNGRLSVEFITYDPDNINKSSTVFLTHKDKLRHNILAVKEDTLDLMCEGWKAYKKRKYAEKLWTYAKQVLKDDAEKYIHIETITATYNIE